MHNDFKQTCRLMLVAGMLGALSCNPAQADLASYITGSKAPPPLQQFTSQGTESLKDAGLANPSTLWIPARYTGSGDALFINGQRYAAPGGFNNVASFIKLTDGYLVAVRQNQLPVVQPAAATAGGGLSAEQTKTLQAQMQKIQQMPNLTAEQRVQMMSMLMQATMSSSQTAQVPAPVTLGSSNSIGVAFYKVGADGQTLAAVGSIPTVHNAPRVLTTTAAIFVERRDGSTASGQLPLFDYIGINNKGQQVVGPQGVLFATPAPDGGWYVKQMIGNEDPSLPYATYSWDIAHIDANGQRTEIYKGSSEYTGQDMGVHSALAFANMPPLADSVRTGYIIRLMHHGAQSMGNDFTDWYASAFSLGEKPPVLCYGLIGRECTYQLGNYTFDLAPVRTTSALAAYGTAQGFILFGTPDDPKVAGQLTQDASAGKGLDYGVVDVKTGERTALFNIMGAGMNTIRNIFGSNTGNADFSRLNDAYDILTPTGLVVVPTAGTAGTDTKPAFDLASDKTISAADMNGFLMQYGFVH